MSAEFKRRTILNRVRADLTVGRLRTDLYGGGAGENGIELCDVIARAAVVNAVGKWRGACANGIAVGYDAKLILTDEYAGGAVVVDVTNQRTSLYGDSIGGGARARRNLYSSGTRAGIGLNPTVPERRAPLYGNNLYAN